MGERKRYIFEKIMTLQQAQAGKKMYRLCKETEANKGRTRELLGNGIKGKNKRSEKSMISLYSHFRKKVNINIFRLCQGI